MAAKISATVGVDGAKQFNQTIAQMNAAAKTLSAEMNAVTTAFIGNEKSMESLRAQNEILTRKVGLLNDKIDTQKNRLQELDKQGVDPTSVQYQKLLKELHNTEAELNRTEAEIKDNNTAMDALEKGTGEAGDAMKETGREVKQAGKEMDDAGDKGLKFGDILKANLASEAIIAGVKALGSALKSCADGLKGMVTDAAAAADEINTLSKTTGLSTDEIQRFQYASEIIDVSVETLTGSMTKLTSNMNSARTGSGKAAEAFEELGIAVTDSSGELRDRQEVFSETINALGRISNETERDALAMQIFGRSAQDLNPLILGGAEALQELGDEAEAAGLILDQNALDSLNGVSDGMAKLQASMTKTKQLLVSSFAGPVAQGFSTVTGYVQRLSSSFAEGGWEAFGDEIGSIVTDALDFITEKLPEFTDTGVAIVEKLASAVMESLPKLAEPALKIVTTLAGKIIDELPTIVNTGANLLLGLLDKVPYVVTELSKKIPALITGLIEPPNGLLSKIPEFVTAGVKLLSSLIDNAGEIISNLCEQLPDLITKLVSGPDGILSHIPEIIDAGVELLSTLTQNVTKIVENLVTALPKLITDLVSGENGILSHIPEIISAGIDLLSELVTDVPAIVKALTTALPEMISGLLDKETGLLAPENLERMFNAGLELFGGIISDVPALVETMIDSLAELVTDIAQELWDRASEFFGVGKEWGDELVAGFKSGVGSLLSTVFTGSGISVSGASKAVAEKAKEINQNSAPAASSDISATEAVEKIVNGFSGLLGGNSTGGSQGQLQANLYIDGQKFAEETVPYFNDAFAAAGLRIGI